MSAGRRGCSSCGGQWFVTAAITLSSAGEVTSYSTPVHCNSCGTQLEDTVSTPAVPDARASAREKARHLNTVDPGTWITWKTYTADQMDTARVAASDIRTGKIKTIAHLVGPVDARTVRLPDGTIGVEVTRQPT